MRRIWIPAVVTLAMASARSQEGVLPVHDLLYERQGDWKRRRRPKGEFEKLAVELGIDGEAFKDCYDEEPGKERIRQNTDTAKELGVRATPTFFVNGTRVLGALPLPEWRKLIEQVRAGAG